MADHDNYEETETERRERQEFERLMEEGFRKEWESVYGVKWGDRLRSPWEEGFRQKWEEGFRRGWEEGVALGRLCRILLNSLESRFGPLSEDVRRKVEETGSVEELAQLLVRVGSAADLDSLGLK